MSFIKLIKDNGMHSYIARLDMTIKNDKIISVRLILFKNFVVIKRDSGGQGSPACCSPQGYKELDSPQGYKELDSPQGYKELDMT